MGTATGCDDDGFTLVELLIVIVVLGILAVVTVFAIRGITDRGAENACSVEFDNLTKAQEVHRALNGTYVDEATLVSSGTITGESTMYDVTATGDSYQVVSAGECAAPSGGPATPPAPVPVVMPTSSFGWHGGVTAWRFGADQDGADEIVVLGREQGKADWVAATDAGASSTRRVHFVDLDSLNVANLASLLNAVDTNGVTALGVYLADDTMPLPGSPAANVHDHLVGVLGPYPAVTLYPLDGAGADLQTLFAAAG
jgi:general secretion pathway protein G